MPDPLIGRQLGDYVIKDLLGRGGMARVYRGYDERLQRYAAVKVISNDFTVVDQAEYTERFRREARSIARLNHPNIVNIYQFGEYEGGYYMAMVFIEGKDLRQILKEYNDQNQWMPLPDAIHIVRDIGQALDYAHSRGVIHRDIKPSNIMLDAENRAVLTDFGLALNASEGTLGDTFGSAHYIAPEQAISSAKAVAQSDLYSLGICLYEMITGKVPFDDPSAMSVALKHLSDPPPPPRLHNPDLPVEIEQAILKVLDKDPTKRFETGALFSRMLETAMGSLAAPALPVAASAPQPAPAAPAPKAEPKKGGAASRKATKTTEAAPAPEPGKPAASKAPTPPRKGSAVVVKENEPTSATPPLSEESKATYPKTREQTDRLPAAARAEAAQVAPGKKDTQPSDTTTLLPADGATDRHRRSVPVVGVLIVALALIVGVGLLAASGAFGGVAGAGTPTLTPSATARDGGTRIAAIGSQTGVTARSVTPSRTMTPIRTNTRSNNSSPTVTASSTLTSTRTLTPTSSATMTPSQTSTATAGPTDIGTRPAVDIILRWDSGQLNLINASGRTLDITDLVFLQRGASERSFEATRWAQEGALWQPTALPDGYCFQVTRIEEGASTPSFRDCRRSGFLLIATVRQFWLAQDVSVTTFEARSGEKRLATCQISLGRCEFKLP